MSIDNPTVRALWCDFEPQELGVQFSDSWHHSLSNCAAPVPHREKYAGEPVQADESIPFDKCNAFRISSLIENDSTQVNNSSFRRANLGEINSSQQIQHVFFVLPSRAGMWLAPQLFMNSMSTLLLRTLRGEID